MAQAQTLKFSKIALLLGDGGTPTELFTAPCGFETLSLTVNIALNDTNIPDCSDADKIAWLISETVSKQAVLAGEGVLALQSLENWRQWALRGLPSEERNVRWFTDSASPTKGFWQAPAVLGAYAENGSRGNRWRQSVELRMNGEPQFTAVV